MLMPFCGFDGFTYNLKPPIFQVILSCFQLFFLGNRLGTWHMVVLLYICVSIIYPNRIRWHRNQECTIDAEQFAMQVATAMDNYLKAPLDKNVVDGEKSTAKQVEEVLEE